MTVMDSVGDGIHARSGGAAQGADWNLSGNGGDGMEVDGATFIVERIEAHGNGHAGVHIREGRNVVLSGGQHLTQWAPRDVWIDWSRARLPSEQ